MSKNDNMIHMYNIQYPYIPKDVSIRYVVESNEYMILAKEYARLHSLDAIMPTGAILVKDSNVIGAGANGSDYHEKNGCERVKQNIPTGEGYELCEGCSPKNHAEPKAISNAIQNGYDLKNADLYLWGHWWCCLDCWNIMLSSGINQVYLMKGSEILFNKENEHNIVGRQFTI
jgi:deoxycytidylate deaminase